MPDPTNHHSWIINTLEDLQKFARQNDLTNLVMELDTVKYVAHCEIEEKLNSGPRSKAPCEITTS